MTCRVQCMIGRDGAGEASSTLQLSRGPAPSPLWTQSLALQKGKMGPTRSPLPA